VHVERIAVENFRNYAAAEVSFPPEGVTLILGGNGAGKTNLLEAVGYSLTLRSFRGATTASMVRTGADQGILRAVAHNEARKVLVDIEIHPEGKDRVQLNRQPVRRAAELVSLVTATTFSPDDIELVKGGPQGRRDYLDHLVGAQHLQGAASLADLERVLRQRNALLRSAAGTLKPGIANALEVWDFKLATIGEQVADARSRLAQALQPLVAQAYRLLSGLSEERGRACLSYRRSWQGALADAILAARSDDVRRGATTVGPHRDDLAMTIGGLPARSQASQGEQRSLALAMRLGSHQLLAEQHGSNPVVLLDDIFSELDPVRSSALAACLPPGQTLLTTAGEVPADLRPAERLDVRAGVVHPVAHHETS